MIYEIRTYRVKVGSLPEVEKRFGEAYEYRKKISPLAAFWHTEIGPLNEIIHVWPYENISERNRLRAEAVKAGNWPPKIAEFIETMQSEIVVPFAFLAPCEYMAKKIPGARLEVIRGAGHSSNLDQPEAFNRVLLDFLAGLPS